MIAAVWCAMRDFLFRPRCTFSIAGFVLFQVAVTIAQCILIDLMPFLDLVP